MTKLAILIAFGALLTGCHAQPTAVPVPHATAPKLLSDAQMRHVLSTAGSSASLWGVTYGQEYYHYWHEERKFWTDRHGRHPYWDRTYIRSYNGHISFSGIGEPLKAAYNRYVYTVPQGQVLVLNHVDGQGTVYINGFGLNASTRHDDGIHYLFGPGDDIVFLFNPSRAPSPGRYASETQDYYYTLTLSGYTISPDLLAGTGALGPGMVK